MTTSAASQLEAGDNIVAPVRAGEVVAEKYLIEETLGVGGMGVVVAARDQLLDRRVAIKFLLPKLAGSDTAVQRFMREARAATRVTSEHVVRLLEVEKLPSGTPFFVMEYLEGSDLRAVLRERGTLTASLAVDFVLQALQAVAEGHVKGIVHRDLKPGNLFLTSRADGTALIKVLDFGIAKTLDGDSAESTSLTSSDDVRLGSPAYMPPEQLQNPRDVDKRSDIWSLGATLYELLCGRPPFEGPGYLELASRILSQPPIPLAERQMSGAVPSGLEAILRKCLEKDRDARYANAAELAAALAPFGSADARVSLARVAGMFQSNPTTPALSRHILPDPESCTATLEVPTGIAVNPDHRRTSDISAVAATVAARPGRSWLILGAAAVLIVGVFALRSPMLLPPRASDAGLAPPVVAPAAVALAASVVAPASVAPASVALAPVVPTPVAFAPIAPAPAVLAPLAVAPGAAPEPALAASAAAKAPPFARIAAPATRLVSAMVAPRALVEPDAAAADAPATAPAPEPSASPALGRSYEIERLIEVRQ